MDIIATLKTLGIMILSIVDYFTILISLTKTILSIMHLVATLKTLSKLHST